jgi:hypothetical protein
MAMSLDDFLKLSAALTGVSEEALKSLPVQKTAEGKNVALGQVYLNRLTAAYPKKDGTQASFAAEFAALEKAWQEVQGSADPEAELAKRLAVQEAKDLRLAARQVIKVWYLSIFDHPDPDNLKRDKNRDQLGGDLGQYQQSVVWQLVGAYVPGYSKGQYGYWVSKPESTEH